MIQMFRNMKIAKKLIVSFVITVLISSIASVVGFVLISNLDKEYGVALVENGFVQGDIGNYNAYLNKGAAMVRDIITLTDPAEKQNAQTQLEEAKVLTQEAIDRTRPLCQSPEELALFAKIDEASPKFKEARDRAVALGLQNKSEEAMSIFLNEARPYLLECTAAGEEIMAINVKMGNEVSTRLSQQAATGEIAIVVIIIVSAILALILATAVSRGISHPVKACADRLVLLSQGDLHSPVPAATSRDEVGVMLDALGDTTDSINLIIGDIKGGLAEMADGNLAAVSNAEYKGDFTELRTSIYKILDSLNETLGQINLSSDQVSAGSDQVSSGAQALSQGATEQASSVQELAATIAEISEHIKNNANNAVTASRKSAVAGEEVEASNRKMQELIAAMQEISNSSKEIGKVIKTIEDIAFQTNILALNAAVEAARAGAAGKGFAVVADEVRNLASKSAEAAKGTTALIESAVKSVENGTRLADDTAKSLVSVVDGTREVAALVNKIAEASNEQASSSAQVTQGIDQISSVVQTNSATAEESAAASEELSGQAAMLRELVGKFRLRDNATESLKLDVAVTAAAPQHRPSESFTGAGKY